MPFGDKLSRHLKDMAKETKAGRKMENKTKQHKKPDTRLRVSHGYIKTGRQNFRSSNSKHYERTSSQKTSQQRPFLGYRGHRRVTRKSPTNPTTKTNRNIDEGAYPTNY